MAWGVNNATQVTERPPKTTHRFVDRALLADLF